VTKLVMMDVPEWIAVPGNPRQRNTEERLRRSKHFDVIEKPHLELRAGELPDGGLVKLDGHTRAAKWMSHLAEAPQGRVLFVIVHEIPDLDEAMRLYDMYDSQLAVEDSRDKVYGAFRQMGWTPESKFMRDARLTTALKLALTSVAGDPRFADPHLLVEYWFPECGRLDLVNLRTEWMNAGCTAAALATVRRRGDAAVEFWRLVNHVGGTKDAIGMDGVEALRYLIMDAKTRKKNFAAAIDTMHKAVACVEKYLSGDVYNLSASGKPVIRGMDISTYIPQRAPVKLGSTLRKAAAETRPGA
jgi:hypothetical protein